MEYFKDEKGTKIEKTVKTDCSTQDNMSGSSKRKFLYDSVLESVKENSAGMEIGLVRAVLNEIDTHIAMLANRNSIDSVWKNERKPCESKKHSQDH